MTVLPDEVQDFFDNINDSTKNKEAYGEVFTPFDIVDKMISKIPYTTLNNCELRWLDTSVGVGHIIVKVYYKLLEYLSLSSNFKSEKEASKHIIEKMLFMTEINPESCQKVKQLFKIINPNAKPNIIECDFLECNDVNNIDVIIMNPPYNSGGTKCNGQKNLYVNFAFKAMEILKPNGYYLAIHPSTYRINDYKPRGTKLDINKLYNSYNIMDISMFTVWQTYELMKVQINTDIILINKSNIEHNTLIEDIYGKYHYYKVEKNKIIPNFGFGIINKLIKSVSRYGSLRNLVYHTSEIHHEAWKKGKIQEGEYKIIHLLKKNENKVYYSNKKHTHQNTPKIIINGLGNKYVFFDKVGEYGVTDSPYIILSDSENIYKLLKSRLFIFVVNSLGILGNNLKPFIFDYLPNVNNFRIQKEFNNDDDLLKMIGFSVEERKQILDFTNNNVQNLKLKDRMKREK